MIGTPRNSLATLTVLGLLPPFLALLNVANTDARAFASLSISAAISVVGYFVTKFVVPIIKNATLRAGLSGRDINKKGSKEGEKDVPESLGALSLD